MNILLALLGLGVLNVLEKSGLYGTIHRLSTKTSFHLIFVVNVLPFSFGERRRYSGYPSFPLIDSESSGRG